VGAAVDGGVGEPGVVAPQDESLTEALDHDGDAAELGGGEEGIPAVRQGVVEHSHLVVKSGPLV